MDKPQYYALTLDDYATVSFCSFSKFYYGTLDDLIPFMEVMEKENEKPDMIAAFKDFILGNTEATHAVAYNQHKLLTPVVFHQGIKQTYINRSWTHKKTYMVGLMRCMPTELKLSKQSSLMKAIIIGA